MPTSKQSVYIRGFSAVVTVIVAAAVIGIGASVVYVSSQNNTSTEQTATSTATNTPANQTESGQVTMTGSVTEIDMSAMTVDGPAKITISSDSEGTQTIQIPARAGQCSQSADVISLDNISVGDQISVRGSWHADSIAPCRTPDGFMRKQTSSQENGDDQSAVKTTLTDTFRGQKFTATVRKEGGNMWRYDVSGSLPNPCWDYTVETDPISPVADNQQQTYRIHVTATPPKEDEMCSQVVQSVEESGQIQDSTTNVKFELRVDEAGELPDLPA